MIPHAPLPPLTVVTVPDPDDPSGSPAYEAPAWRAGRVLDPGEYVGTVWDGDAAEPLPVLLTVTPNGATLHHYDPDAP